MKKILISLTLFMLAVTVFAACVDNNDNSDLSEAYSKDQINTPTESSFDVDSSAEESIVNNESQPLISEDSDDGSISDEASESVSHTDNEDTSDTDLIDGSDAPDSDTSDNYSSDTGDNSSSDTPDVSDEPDVSNEPDDDEEEEPVFTDIGDAELLPTGYIVYDGAAYSAVRYSSEYGRRYADVYNDYSELFPHVRISVINHPGSAMNIVNPLVREMVADQGEVLDRMEACIYGDVNFVNLKDIFTEHRGEYLYFKSDFHWTQLGAYYAYCAFAESVGLTPTPLSSFEERIVTDSFHGRTNEYAQDPRVDAFIDTVYAYMPRKRHTYTVYNGGMDIIAEYGNAIQTSIQNYSCFLTGDQPFAIINVPENNQSKTALVIKESSGNAFVPFLIEHYGNIIVVDPRHIHVDVRDLVPEYGIDDIIFFATASTSNRSGYCDYYNRMIGQ